MNTRRASRAWPNPISRVGPLMLLLVGVVGLITILVLLMWRRLRAPVGTG